MRHLRRKTLRISLMILAFGLPLAMPLLAQEPIEPAADAPTLPSNEAGEFLGEWVLTMDSPDGSGAVDIDLLLRDDGGIAVGEFDMPQVGHQTVRHIVKTDDGIDLKFQIGFGDQVFKITMNLARSQEGLTGTLGDEGGLFSMAFTGVDKETALALASTDEDAQARRRRGRSASLNWAELKVGEAAIKVRYDIVTTDAKAFALLQKPQDGKVVPFLNGRPHKLMTDVDLKFGDAKIAAGNAAPNYPGVYALWLENEGGQWYLIFNEYADVWGTQYDPTGDVAKVPLELSKSEEELRELTPKLVGDGDAYRLEIGWGTVRLSAPFTVASEMASTG